MFAAKIYTTFSRFSQISECVNVEKATLTRRSWACKAPQSCCLLPDSALVQHCRCDALQAAAARSSWCTAWTWRASSWAWTRRLCACWAPPRRCPSPTPAACAHWCTRSPPALMALPACWAHQRTFDTWPGPTVTIFKVFMSGPRCDQPSLGSVCMPGSSMSLQGMQRACCGDNL